MRIALTTSFIGSTLDLITQVHQCSNRARTTFICYLFTLQYSAQLPLVGPRSCGSLDCHFVNQGIQIGCSNGFEIGPVLEQSPVHPLERVVHLLFDSVHLVHRRTGVANGVKLVKRDSGIGQMRW